MIIGEVKFSCSPCIKGHRSANCNHADRPLIEIKKKGRPPTQCAKCRELRKTKAVHGKCVCDERVENKAPLLTLASSTASFPCSCADPSNCTCAASASSRVPIRQSSGGVSSSSSIQRGTSIRKLKKEEEGGRELSHGHASSARHSTHYDPYSLPPINSHRSNSISSQHSNFSHHSFLDGPPPIWPKSLSPPSFDGSTPSPVPTPGQNRLFYLPTSNESNNTSASLCYCGPSCTCPGCPDHAPQTFTNGSIESRKCGNACSSFGLCCAGSEVADGLPEGVSSIEDLMAAIIDNPEEDSRMNLFSQQMNHLQSWPSTSDLTQSNSISHHSYSGSQHQEVDNRLENLLNGAGNNQVDSGEAVIEGITRWRSDLENGYHHSPQISRTNSFTSQNQSLHGYEDSQLDPSRTLAISSQSGFDSRYSSLPPTFYSLPVSTPASLSYSPTPFIPQSTNPSSYRASAEAFNLDYRDSFHGSDAGGSYASESSVAGSEIDGGMPPYEDHQTGIEFEELDLGNKLSPIDLMGSHLPNHQYEEEQDDIEASRNSGQHNGISLERFQTERPGDLKFDRFRTERPPDQYGVANGGEGTGIGSEMMSKSNSFFRKMKEKIGGGSDPR